VRAAVATHGGGHATLLRANESIRAAVDVFQPLPGPLAALSARVKTSFDPHRVLNPGRMYAGI
jgi:glycolate dehydrogenase FAD-binding subunit